jgi:glycosyltransferase involved in cell wall biosynthesis
VTPGAQPTVAVLMCTHNGEAYLGQQLESIAAQSHPHWRLWVSDDQSTDGTPALLAAWAGRWGEGRCQVLRGPAQGHARNFMALVRNPAIEADFYAWCDQDDVWEPGKLERALARLAALPADQPALYGGRTRYVDERGAEVGLSPLFARPPGFANALTQSIAGGNTMVFNQAARELLRRTDPDAPVVTHDWLAYLVVTGCGGHVVYDPWPSVRYRQHGRNAIGAGAGWGARFARWRGVWDRRHQDWHRANSRALRPLEGLLTPANRRMLRDFDAARDEGLLRRLGLLHGLGLYRQTRLQTLSLYFAMAFNRL